MFENQSSSDHSFAAHGKDSAQPRKNCRGHCAHRPRPRPLRPIRAAIIGAAAATFMTASVAGAARLSSAHQRLPGAKSCTDSTHTILVSAAGCRVRAIARSLRSGKTANFVRCDQRLESGLVKLIDLAPDCDTPATESLTLRQSVLVQADELTESLAEGLEAEISDTPRCQAKRLNHVAKFIKCLVRTPDDYASCASRFSPRYDSVATKPSCASPRHHSGSAGERTSAMIGNLDQAITALLPQPCTSNSDCPAAEVCVDDRCRLAICGDGVIGGREQCESGADEACPGLCSLCQCPPQALEPNTIRIGYMIPSNREPAPSAVANLQALLIELRAWICEQMDRNGFGARGFSYETEEDGVTPRVHIVGLAEPDTYFQGRDSQFAVMTEAASRAGVPTWVPGQVWLYLNETHAQTEDGTFTGTAFQGGSYGSGSDPGLAQIGSDSLGLAGVDILSALMNDTPYDGLLVPRLGPLPLQRDVTWPWFMGSTVSSVNSSFVGCIAHEIGHGLGLGHDFRNDFNAHGNMMGNGCRGIRGNLFPDRYPGGDMRLSHAAALVLSVSRYMEECSAPEAAPVGTTTPERERTIPETSSPDLQATSGLRADQTPIFLSAYPGSSNDHADACLIPPVTDGTDPTQARISSLDENRPDVTVDTQGTVSTVGGLLRITFEAHDDVGLSAAILQSHTQGTIGEMELSGLDGSWTFETPIYTPDTLQHFDISVYDLSGNRTKVLTSITPSVSDYRAPLPFFTARPSAVTAGDEVTLDALSSTDPWHTTASLIVEWDLDGDLVFDTAPTADKQLVVSFSEPGTRLVRLRLTNPDGVQSVSTPIALRITPAASTTQQPLH